MTPSTLTLPNSSFAISYDLLLSYAAAESAQSPAQTDAFFTAVAKACVSSISALASFTFSFELVAAESSDSGLAWAESPDTVFVGLVLLRSLGEAALAFSGYLLRNFMLQQMGLGPAVPLPLLVRAESFPRAALALYAPNMLPDATTPAGTLRDDYDAVRASMLTSGSVSLSDILRVQGRMAKRPAAQDWLKSLESARGLLRGEPLPHLLLLFAHIFSNSLALVITHEASHLLLGHLDGLMPTPERSREYEVAADGNAVSLLMQSEDFDLHAAILLFGFLSQSDKSVDLNAISHPFAANRLAVLAASIVGVQNPALEADLNAGLSLIRKPLRVEDQDKLLPPGVTMLAWVSSSLYYIATVTVEITAPGNVNSAWEEELWTKLELSCDLTIRDRVHPAEVMRSGNVVSALISTQSELRPDVVKYFCTLALDAPPSWWMDIPGGTLTIERATLRSATSLPAARDTPHLYWSSPAQLTDELLLQHFQTALQETPATAVRAARRAITRESEPVALGMSSALGASLREPELDLLLWLAPRLLDRGEHDRAVQLLQNALLTCTYVPLGLRGLLARAKWELYVEEPPPTGAPKSPASQVSTLCDSSVDLAFREMNSSIDTPEHDAALQLIGEIRRKAPSSRAMTAILQANQLFGEALPLMQGNPQQAEQCFTTAVVLLRAADDDPDTPLIYLKQLCGEMLFAKAGCREHIYSEAAASFHEVLAADPSFLPGLTGLAKIQLEGGDFPALRVTLRRADRIAPNHPFLKGIQSEFQRRFREETTSQRQPVSAAMQAEEYGTALQLTNAWLQMDADSTEGVYMRSMVNYALGDVQAARSDLEHYVEVEGEQFDAVLMLGQMLLELGSFREAGEILTKLMGAAQHSPGEEVAVQERSVIPYSGKKGVAFARAARALAGVQDDSKTCALTEAEQAALDFPSGGQALLNCAEVFRVAGQISKARDLVTQALQASELPLLPRQTSRGQAFLNDPDVQLVVAAVR